MFRFFLSIGDRRFAVIVLIFACSWLTQPVNADESHWSFRKILARLRRVFGKAIGCEMAATRSCSRGWKKRTPRVGACAAVFQGFSCDPTLVSLPFTGSTK